MPLIPLETGLFSSIETLFNRMVRILSLGWQTLAVQSRKSYLKYGNCLGFVLTVAPEEDHKILAER